MEIEATGLIPIKSQRSDGAGFAFRFLITVVFWKKGISNVCSEADRRRGDENCTVSSLVMWGEV